MTFLEEIKEMENNRNSKESIVINDILDYFRVRMESDDFKNTLKNNYIKKAINNGKHTTTLHIEFWEYRSGCSNTYFSVGGCGRWELDPINNVYDSYYSYKGIRLCDIHKNICSKLSTMLKDKIKELGLEIVSSARKDNDYRFGYYNEDIEIKW